MPEGKTLRFEMVLDEQSFQRVKRALGELQTEAQKLAKALQGAQGGLFSGANVGGRTPSAVQSQGRLPVMGGSTQRTGIGSAILGDVQAFQSLAKEGAKGMEQMSAAIRRGIGEQLREMKSLDQQLNILQERYNKLGTAAERATNLERQIITKGMRRSVEEKGGSLEQLYRDTFGGGTGLLPAATQPGAGGLMSRFFGGALRGVATGGMGGLAAGGVGGMVTGGLGGGAMGGLMAVGGTAAAVASGVAAGVGIGLAVGTKAMETSKAIDFKAVSMESRLGRALSPAIGRAKSGDVSDLDVISVTNREDMLDAAKSVFGTDAYGLQRIQALKETLSGDFTGKALGDKTRAAMQAEEYEQLMSALKDSAKYRLGIAWGREYADQTRGSRLAASRVLGRGFKSTQGFNIKTGQPEEMLEDSFSGWANQMYERGFSVEEAIGGYLASAHATGSGAYSTAFAHANASGWGEFGNVLGGAAHQGGGLPLALMALGGGINRAAGIQLGQAVIGTGFDPRGTVSSAGVLGAFQGGYGSRMGAGSDPASHFNLVNQFAQGLSVGDAIVGGSTSGFQTGMNILGAISSAPGAGVYAQDYLATGMTAKQMLAGARGDLTETAKMMGITPEQIKRQLGMSASAALAPWVDQGGSDRISQAMRKYKKSGLNPEEFLKTASWDEAGAIGAMLSRLNPTQFGEEGGIGWARSLVGAGTEPGTGNQPFAKIDTKEQKDREGEIKTREEAQRQLDTYWDTLLKNTTSTDKGIQAVKTAADGTTAAVLTLAAWMMSMSPNEVRKIQGSNIVNAVATYGTLLAGPNGQFRAMQKLLEQVKNATE